MSRTEEVEGGERGDGGVAVQVVRLVESLHVAKKERFRTNAPSWPVCGVASL